MTSTLLLIVIDLRIGYASLWSYWPWFEIKCDKQEVFQMKTQEINMTGNLPERKFRAGAISATVWSNKTKNKTGEEVQYKTISVDRCYKDKDGQWQTTNSMRVNDLPKAWTVLMEAYKHIVFKEQEMFKEE